jgi:hypothetical protein
MSKQDHRVVVDRVLRPRVMLRCKQELATAARAWRPADGSGMRGAREGSRGGEQGWGRGRTTRGGRSSRRWRGGGSRAAAKGVALPAAGGETEQRSTCSRKKKRGERSGGPVWKFQEFQGPHGKERFPTDIGV